MDKKLALYGGVAVAAAVVGYLLYKKAGKTLSTTLNPASDQNAAYKGANATLAAVTGNNTDTVGTWLFGLFNPSAAAGSSQVTPLANANMGGVNFGVTDAGSWEGAPQQTSGAPLLSAAASGPSLTDITSGQPLDYLLGTSKPVLVNPLSYP